MKNNITSWQTSNCPEITWYERRATEDVARGQAVTFTLPDGSQAEGVALHDAKKGCIVRIAIHQGGDSCGSEHGSYGGENAKQLPR